MEIRAAQLADIPALSALAKKTWVDAFGHSVSAEQLAAILEETRSEAYFYKAIERDIILVAAEGHNLLGYVKFGEVRLPVENLAPKAKGLHRLYVGTQRQGQGVGSQLMEAALAHPLLHQARHIYLAVWVQNQRARQLYERFGFEVVGEYYPIEGGDADLIMCRNQQTSPQNVSL